MHVSQQCGSTNVGLPMQECCQCRARSHAKNPPIWVAHPQILLASWTPGKGTRRLFCFVLQGPNARRRERPWGLKPQPDCQACRAG